MIKQLFYFDDHLRWSFIFENPNVAGAFIAILLSIPLSFENFGANKRILIVSFLVELVLWICLIGTYSRGAFVAALFCTIFHFCLFILFSKFSRKFKILFFVLKSVLIVILIFSFGFSKRISGDYLRNDGSTNARITLWRGGLEMLYLNPVLGWGDSKSGEEYMNWFQDLDDHRVYGGMVNSYLHIGVERGLPILAMFIFLLLALAIFSMRESFFSSDYARRVCFSLSGFSLCMFALVNIFSTLWIFPSLAIAVLCISSPCIIAILLHKGIKFSSFLNDIKFSFIITFVLVCLLFVFGRIFRGNLYIEKLKSFYKIREHDSNGGKNILILCDNSVLGDTYGKEIRRLFDLDYAKNLNVFVVSENQCVNDKLKHYDYDAVFLFGKRVEDLVDVKTTATYLINPIGDPSKFKSDNCDTIVVLSKLDTFNQHSRWKSLIGNRKVIFKTLDFGTQRIENVFKAIYTE